MKLIISHPWFVFIRNSIDEQSDNPILQTMFTVHLTILLRDLIRLIRLTPMNFLTFQELPVLTISDMMSLSFFPEGGGRGGAEEEEGAEEEFRGGPLQGSSSSKSHSVSQSIVLCVSKQPTLPCMQSSSHEEKK
jgi:hypothetical protein